MMGEDSRVTQEHHLSICAYDATSSAVETTQSHEPQPKRCKIIREEDGIHQGIDETGRVVSRLNILANNASPPLGQISEKKTRKK